MTIKLDAPNGIKSLDTFIASELDSRTVRTPSLTATDSLDDSYTTTVKKSPKQGVVVISIRNPNPPGNTSDAAVYNSIKELFELADQARINGGLETAYGGTVIGPGPARDDLNRPPGTDLPARCFEHDGNDTPPFSTQVLEADWLAAFNGALSASGLVFTPSTNLAVRQTNGIFNGTLFYSTLFGLNLSGVDDPSEPGNAPGTAISHVLPAETGKYIFVAGSTNGVANVDWMSRFNGDMAAIMQVFQLFSIPLDNLPAPTSPVAVPGGSSGEIDVSWTGPNQYWAHEDDDCFSIHYGLNTDDVNDRRLTIQEVSSPHTINGLIPGETYFIGISTRRPQSGTLLGSIQPSFYHQGLELSDNGPLSTIVSTTAAT